MTAFLQILQIHRYIHVSHTCSDSLSKEAASCPVFGLRIMDIALSNGHDACRRSSSQWMIFLWKSGVLLLHQSRAAAVASMFQAKRVASAIVRYLTHPSVLVRPINMPYGKVP